MYRLLLLLFVTQCCFSKILFCSYESDFLKFNDIIIRETVSSKNIISYFAVDIPQIKDITSDYSSSCSISNEYSLTKYKFGDTLIKNNTILLNKYNYTSPVDHLFNIVGIFKSSPKYTPQPSLFINIFYDNKIIVSNELNSNNNAISFYEQLLSEPGFHTFEIQVQSKGIWCLCPSKGTGFENNKYIFAWTDVFPLFNDNKYTYLEKISDNNYSQIRLIPAQTNSHSVII